MNKDKLLLDYNGRSLLQRAVDLMSELPVYERILVTVKNKPECVNIPPDMRVCINTNPESGLSSSVRLGVVVATGTHFLFLNADQPRLTLIDLLPVIKVAEENPDKIIYPVINSKPVTPTLFPEIFKPDLMSLSGDTGGRHVRDKYKKSNQTIKPENPGNFKDIDTEEDLINYDK